MTAMKAAVDNGFEAFELFAEFPQCVPEEVTEKQKQEGRALVRESGIALAVHAPFNSLNIAALNPGIRKESIRQTIYAVDLCADLGGRVVVVHTGEYITSERLRKKVPEAGTIQWELNTSALKEIAAHAKERGVILALENIGFEIEHMDQNVDDMLKIKKEIDEPALAFCLDIGHARLNDELPEAIEKMGPHTAHIHFTDNFGEKDDHVIIGKGNFDYTPHLGFFRSFPHIMTLEVVVMGTDPRPAIKSRDNVKTILKVRG
jgi:sugar phosphate isomerase/epimerase